MFWIWLAPLIVVGSFVIYLLLSFGMIFFGLHRRYDYNPYLEYFTYLDYPGLKQDRYSFKVKKNTLQAFVYRYPNIEHKGVITFVHGIGAGHEAYTSIIEEFCKNGYIVFAYDQSSSGLSEGKGPFSMLQGCLDLIEANKLLHSLEEFKNFQHYIIGHSWGGFVAGVSSLLPLAKPYNKIVSSSPINRNFYDIVAFQSVLVIFKPAFHIIDFLFSPKLRKISVKNAIKSSNTPTLFIYGTSDNMVAPKLFKAYEKLGKDKENIQFISLEGRKHQPMLSKVAEDIITDEIPEITNLMLRNYKNKYADRLLELKEQIDFKKAIEINEDVFPQILEFLD